MQRLVRGHLARIKLDKYREDKANYVLQKSAAIKVQSFARKFLARKKLHGREKQLHQNLNSMQMSMISNLNGGDDIFLTNEEWMRYAEDKHFIGLPVRSILPAVVGQNVLLCLNPTPPPRSPPKN